MRFSKTRGLRTLFLRLIFLTAPINCGDKTSLGTDFNRDHIQVSRQSKIDPSYLIPDYQAKTAGDSRSPIPIFIITCDRLTWLKRTLVGLDQAIDRPIEIIIHDNNSTFPPMKSFLEELEAAGIQVVRHSESLLHEAQLDNIRFTIEDWFTKKTAPFYAVTDPDIEFERHDGKLLDFYEQLLTDFPDVNVVGPILRIDDLPDFYPFKPQILKNEKQRMLDVPSFSKRFNGEEIPITYGAIDTTFGLYRSTFQFRRVNKAIQAYSPYAARHLDWYLDPNNLTDDQNYYLRKASRVSHSGGTWLREYIDSTKENTAE